MGRIKVSAVAKAPIENVFQIGRKVYEYVEYLPNIREIKPITDSDDGNYSKAEWILDVPILSSRGYKKLSWPQEIYWNETPNACRFRICPEYDGIVRRFDGNLFLKPSARGTDMAMDIVFKVEHPLVNPLVHKIFDGLMKRNLESLLHVIKKKAEAC
jgi:hypothetical protein